MADARFAPYSPGVAVTPAVAATLGLPATPGVRFLDHVDPRVLEPRQIDIIKASAPDEPLSYNASSTEGAHRA